MSNPTPGLDKTPSAELNRPPRPEAFEQGGRKNFLINPQFQLSFLGYTLGVSLLTIGLFYAADAYFFWKFQQLGLGLGLPENHVFFQFLGEQHAAKNVYYGIAAGTSISVLGIWGLLLSHRVAGPLHRLRVHFQSVAQGETFGDVRFRKGDFFPEVADAYNEQMVRYREAVHAAGLDQVQAPAAGKVSGKKDSAA